MRRNAAAGLLVLVVEREKDTERTLRACAGATGCEQEAQPCKAGHRGGTRAIRFAEHGPGRCRQKERSVVVLAQFGGAFGHLRGFRESAEGKERPRIVVVGLEVQRIAHDRVVEGGAGIGSAAKSGKDNAP